MRENDVNTISIEEIRKSSQLKKEKCEEVKAAMRDILSDEQKEKFDETFDSAMDKVFKGVMLKEKS